MADKRIICVVLRVHLSCKCPTGNDIHGEAAKTSVKKKHINRKLNGENKERKRPHDPSSFQSLSVYLWMLKASIDSA